ncbi:MAG: DUF6051 family protein [Spirochaetota bacterium]
MGYIDDYQYLTDKFDPRKQCIPVPEFQLEVHNLDFHSNSYTILPGEEPFRCSDHHLSFPDLPPAVEKLSDQLNSVGREIDTRITENNHFKYFVFKPTGPVRQNGVIILLHGLNEKRWEKYLPWSKALVELTGKAVIMFPIAFHMNRAPSTWSNPRLMKELSKKRKQLFPTIEGSSFANAAISTRLQLLPQRFFWSGLQTYFDIIQLCLQIREGRHPWITPQASIDFFGYSIGAFLTEILLMSDPEGMFGHSRLFMFCGGPPLNRMRPVSKYILDSKADTALYEFFINHLENELERNPRLSHFFSRAHPEGNVFKCMLDYHKMKDFREEKISSRKARIAALVLEKDQVIPPYEVINTLQGDKRNIDVKIEIMDFPYRYIHENPFPINKKSWKEVDRSFRIVFNRAGGFLA